MDIRNNPEAIEKINAIVSNGGAAEVKVESRKGEPMLTVVELSRQLKIQTPVKDV